jgi:hypothetical protein
MGLLEQYAAAREKEEIASLLPKPIGGLISSFGPTAEYEQLLERVKGSQHPQDAPPIARTALDRAGNNTAWGDATLGLTGLPSLAAIAHMAQPNNWLNTPDDAAQYWGDKTLAATGSPAAAAAAHTGFSIFGDPIDLVPAAKLGGLAAAGVGGLGWLMRNAADVGDIRRIGPLSELGTFAGRNAKTANKQAFELAERMKAEDTRKNTTKRLESREFLSTPRCTITMT